MMKGERMRIVNLALLFVLAGITAFITGPSSADAACACSKIGQSNGTYTPPSAYGSYGSDYGQASGVQGRSQAQPAKTKSGKAKKKSSKSKSADQ
jgi:hypothetical protein